jgi:hypothetical protein
MRRAAELDYMRIRSIRVLLRRPIGDALTYKYRHTAKSYQSINFIQT